MKKAGGRMGNWQWTGLAYSVGVEDGRRGESALRAACGSGWIKLNQTKSNQPSTRVANVE
jgi:hypothetical protein